MTSQGEYKVFVIIVTYNGEKWIDKCFSSLRNSTIPLKTIVIDNNSSDDSVANLKLNYPEVHVINNAKNLGFGKANNIGFVEAVKLNADYVFLLNQDAWVMPDTIEKLINVQLAHPEYYILSPLHLEGTGTKLDLAFSTYISPYFCENMVSDLILRKDSPKDVYTTSFVNAAFWLISRECLEKIGLFEPLFSHYGEDDNYLQRVIYHGGKIGICPAALGFHDRLQELANVKNFPYEKRYHRQIVRSLIILLNINKSFYHCLMVFLKVRFEYICSSFFKFKMKSALLELKVLFNTLFQISKIKKHRLKNSQIATSVRNLTMQRP